MYTSVRDPQLGSTRSGRLSRISRNVLFLGLTSLFTDVSSEMMTAVLPMYFMFALRMTPMQFGLIDGLYQGASAFVRVASGLVADSNRRYKTVAVVGYALSTVCKAGLLVVGGSVGAITSLLMVDRLGKGIRTAPRDALITLSSDPAHLGEAFGAHRAMDTVGAVIGPVIAFAVLAASPSAYDAVFVVSLAFGVIGVSLIALFVDNRRGENAPLHSAPLATRLAGPFGRPRFTALLVAGGLLGLMTASDAMIYLLLQRSGRVPATLFPLLFVGTSMVYLLSALPIGRLADRLGQHRTFIAGHVAIVLLYATLLVVPHLSVLGVMGCVALLGLYYAATDGVLPALASRLLPQAEMTTGLALVTTAAATARLFAATIFGAVWTWIGPADAVAVFLGGLLTTIVAGALALRLQEPWPDRFVHHQPGVD